MERKELILAAALIFLGIGFFGETVGMWRLDWFLESWWVLFILVPSIGNMRDFGLTRGNLLGFSLGLTLLLVAWVPAFRPFAVSYILIIAGLIIFMVPKSEM